MKRFSVVLLCLIASTVGFLGAQSLVAVDNKNKQAASDRVRQDFELMKLFAEAYEQIDSNYVREVDRRELVDAAIRGMATHLDQYSTYIPPQDLTKFEQYIEQEFVGIGIHVHSVNGKLEIISPLPGSPAFRAGVRTGDVISEIDGKATTGLTPPDVARLLAGPPGRSVILGVRRPNSDAIQQFTIVRETIQLPTVIGMKRDAEQQWDFMLDDQKKIGYVRITHFSRNTAGEFRKALESLESRHFESLVLDLRSNPGGLMESSIEIADMLLDSGSIVSMKGRTMKERTWRAKQNNTVSRVSLAVLVNRLSASASEVLSASLQDNDRAVIIGERTWGKGSIQNVVQLESGRSALKLTTASYFRPSGVNIHRFPDSKKEDDWGVKPSDGHVVELSKEQWLEWVGFRETADLIRGQSPEPATETYDDRQLKHATAFLAARQEAAPSAAPETPAANISKSDAAPAVEMPN